MYFSNLELKLDEVMKTLAQNIADNEEAAGKASMDLETAKAALQIAIEADDKEAYKAARGDIEYAEVRLQNLSEKPTTIVPEKAKELLETLEDEFKQNALKRCKELVEAIENLRAAVDRVRELDNAANNFSFKVLNNMSVADRKAAYYANTYHTHERRLREIEEVYDGTNYAYRAIKNEVEHLQAAYSMDNAE